jgi:hypothetical protein
MGKEMQEGLNLAPIEAIRPSESMVRLLERALTTNRHRDRDQRSQRFSSSTQETRQSIQTEYPRRKMPWQIEMMKVAGCADHFKKITKAIA